MLLCFLAAAAFGHGRTRLPRDYAAWSRVVRCESGGWRVLGVAYPDPFGITAANWMAAGGRPLKAGWMTTTQRVAAIRIADRFIRQYRIPIPDSEGCAAW